MKGSSRKECQLLYLPNTSTPIAITKQDVARIFDPLLNQELNAWQLDYRKIPRYGSQEQMVRLNIRRQKHEGDQRENVEREVDASRSATAGKDGYKLVGLGIQRILRATPGDLDSMGLAELQAVAKEKCFRLFSLSKKNWRVTR